MSFQRLIRQGLTDSILDFMSFLRITEIEEYNMKKLVHQFPRKDTYPDFPTTLEM